MPLYRITFSTINTIIINAKDEEAARNLDFDFNDFIDDETDPFQEVDLASVQVEELPEDQWPEGYDPELEAITLLR